MKINSRLIGVSALSLSLSGCFLGTTQPLLQSAGKDFAGGVDSASKILNNQISDAAKTERAIQGFALAKVPSSNDVDREFKKFACAGLDLPYASDQRAAVAGLQQVQKVVTTLTADPSGKFDEVLASIDQYSDQSNWPQLKLREADRGAAAKECEGKVTAAISILRPDPSKAAALPLAEIEGLYSAAKTLVEDIKKAILAIYQEKDWAQREVVLKAFLNDPKTQTGMQNLLGACAIYDKDKAKEEAAKSVEKKSEKKKGDEEQTEPNLPACSGGGLDNTKVEFLFNRRVAGLIAVPYAQFVDVADPNSQRSVTRKVESLSAISTNLVDFDAVRLQKAPNNVGAAIASAYLTLRRLADGYLTVDEQRKNDSANLKRLMAYLQSLESSLDTIKKDAAAVKDATEKLP